MPAKRRPKHAAPASQEDQIQAAFNKFSLHLDKAKEAPGLIGVPPATLKCIDGIIKTSRAKSTLINQPCVDDLVGKLDNDEDGNLCGRLNSEAFCLTLRIVLQMEPCKEAERVLHLLAVSLFEDSQDQEKHDDLDKKKDFIGAKCLTQLLNYFIHAENDFGMRRWAGLLCIQLVIDCDRNHSRLENAPENSRRGIGRQVVEESDEILKVIYAQLVRVMVDKETPLENMFPQHYEEKLYADFPPSSQSNAGWVVQFQAYMDDVSKNPSIKAPDAIGYLFFATTIKLIPGDQLGPRHHNAVLFVDGAQLSFLATSREGYFDTILDVPISSIKKMEFVTDHTSQVDSRRITLDIVEHNETDDEVPCFLDSKEVQLQMVAFSMRSDSIDNFQNIILQFQDDIEISHPDSSENGGSDYTQVTTKVSSMNLGGIQARTQVSLQELGSSNELSHHRMSGSQADFGTCTKSQHDPDDSNVEGGEYLQEEDLYDATPEKAQNKALSPEIEPAKLKPKPTNPRVRKVVKPKAKPPIVPGRHSLDSQLTMAKLNSQVAKIKPAKEDDGNGQGSKLTQAKASTNAGTKKLAGSTTSANRTKKGTKAKAPSQTVLVTKKPTATSTGSKARQQATKKSAEQGAVASKKSAVVHKIDPAYDFSDNFITSPDANDASTPRVSKTKSGAKPTKAATKPIASQSMSNMAKAHDSAEPPRKRYGLHKPTDNASNDRDGSLVEVKSKAAKNPPKPRPKPETKAPKSRASAKADVKKRQSAPGALQPPQPATRQSRRAAASDAKDKMQGMDESHDEKEVEDPSPIKSKSKITEDEMVVATQKPPKLAELKKIAAEPESPSLRDDQNMFDLQAEDARSLGLMSDKSPPIEQNQDGDPYDASPRSPAKNVELVPNVPKKLDTSSKAGQKQARNSGMDLANKLVDSLGYLDSEPEKVEPQLPVPKKSVGVKKIAQQEESQKTQKTSEKYEAIRAAGDEVGSSKQQTDEELPSQSQPPSEHDRAPSALNVDVSTAPSPALLLSDDMDTPFPENAVPNQDSPDVPYAPIFQETIETQLKTQTSVGVLNVSKHSLLAQISDNSSTALSNGDGALAGNPITLVEGVHQVGIVHVPKKRKPVPAKPTAAKRRRADKEDTQEVHEQDSEPASPAKVKNVTTKISRKSKTKSSSPMRKSPRLAAKVTHQPAELQKAAPEASSVIKDPSRKRQVINFGGQGPRNQGVGSARKPNNRTSAMEAREEVSPAEVRVADRKRKREKANLAEVVSPPKKKQNSSPVVVEEDHFAIEPNSSPPTREVKSKPDRQRLTSRPSSQASRVDRNGSPIADESPIDHFGKLKRRLAEPEVQSKPQSSKNAPEARTAVAEKEVTRPRRASQIFGPKISLGGKLKARPSSPTEPNSRYIAHGEADGVYTDVDTKQVVEEEKVLADPFVERSRKSTDFIERLQSSESKDNITRKDGPEPRRHSRETRTARDHRAAAIRSNEDQELPELARWKPDPHRAAAIRSNEGQEIPELTRQKPALYRGLQRIGFAKQAERKTRLDIYEQSSPTDMTSGTSYGSRSSDAARTPLQEVSAPNETWNLAVRPHYNTLGQAVHRIADELMIRLSSEEDRMDLLVDQYKGNGTKILDKLNEKRENERGTISRDLDQKKSQMAAVYAESRDVIMETEECMREHSTSHFEMDWRRKQNAIRKQISEGRKSSEN